MRLVALKETYYYGTKQAGQEFEADDVNGRVLVEIVQSCRRVDGNQTTSMKAEEPPTPPPPAPSTPPEEPPASEPMTTETAEPLTKRRTYKRRDMRAEE